MQLHPSITVEEILATVQRDENEGFCVACGAVRDGCEPDARQYQCEACGEFEVYGAEELLIMTAA